MRAAPPEGCAGPNAFLEERQEHHSLAVIERLLALIDNPDDYLDPYEELRRLHSWAGVNRCDRHAVNWRLREDGEPACDDAVSA